MIYIIPSVLVNSENEREWQKKTRMLFEVTAPNFWYMHGVLEGHFHYDKAFMFVDEETKENSCTEIDGRLTLNEGIYDVNVEQYDNPCRAYIFHRKSGQYVDMRGLVVDTTDKEDVKKAVSLFNKKPSWM